jgi:putative membrane protein
MSHQSHAASTTEGSATASTLARVRDHRRREWTALIGGVVVILGAVLPPFDEAADRSFSAHMLQHVLLINVGAPLLAIAWPLLLGRWRDVTWLNGLARPVPALVLSTAALWSWHIPAVYDFALKHEVVHALEHLMFIGAFMLFWRPLMNDAIAGSQLRTNESRVLYLTIGMFATGLLAALITFSGHLLYPFYAASASGGRSPLADEHLGGGVMWVAGAVTFGLAVLLTLQDEP